MQIFKIAMAVLATTFVASCTPSSPEAQSGKESPLVTYGNVASYELSLEERELMRATTMASSNYFQLWFREASRKKLEISREIYKYEDRELLPQSQSVLYCNPHPQAKGNRCIFVYTDQSLNVTEMQCDPNCLSIVEEQRFGTSKAKLSQQITSVIDARGISSYSTLIEDDDKGTTLNGVTQEPPVTFEEGQPLILKIEREQVAGELPHGGSLILPPLPFTMTEQDLLEKLEVWEESVRSKEDTYQGTLTLVLMRISDVSAQEQAQLLE
jgi:hypothetical protein